MKRTVRFYSKDTKRGTNEKGEWVINDIHVTWTEEGLKNPQESVVSVRGEIREDLFEHAKMLNADVPMTIFFSVREYNGRKYPNITGYLPDEYMVKTPKEEK